MDGNLKPWKCPWCTMRNKSHYALCCRCGRPPALPAVDAKGKSRSQRQPLIKNLTKNLVNPSFDRRRKTESNNTCNQSVVRSPQEPLSDYMPPPQDVLPGSKKWRQEKMDKELLEPVGAGSKAGKSVQSTTRNIPSAEDLHKLRQKIRSRALHGASEKAKASSPSSKIMNKKKLQTNPYGISHRDIESGRDRNDNIVHSTNTDFRSNNTRGQLQEERNPHSHSERVGNYNNVMFLHIDDDSVSKEEVSVRLNRASGKAENNNERNFPEVPKKLKADAVDSYGRGLQIQREQIEKCRDLGNRMNVDAKNQQINVIQERGIQSRTPPFEFVGNENASNALHDRDNSLKCLDEEKNMYGLARQFSPKFFKRDQIELIHYAQRIANFKYAQQLRRGAYGDERPWGILGLYDHLSDVRTDIEWAEHLAKCQEYKLNPTPWSKFDESKNTGVNRPFFTYFVLVMCTVYFIASIGENGWKVEPLSVNPMIGPSKETLIDLGAKDSNLIVNERELWRLIAPMFLHAGLIHFSINMIALNAIGSSVEMAHGTLAAAVIFCVPAVGGTILSAIFLPDYISVGASGGIFGLIGACLMDIFVNWSLLFGNIVDGPGQTARHNIIILVLLIDISLNCLIGITPFVDNWTHMGGMFYGMFCAMWTTSRICFSPGDDESHAGKDKYRRVFGAIVVFVAIVSSTGFLLTGDGKTSPCPACQRVSCISLPLWTDMEHKWWYCDDCSSASAFPRLDEETGYYDMLTITCPDNTQVSVELGDSATDDKEWLENKLAGYCRMNCASVYRH